MTNSRNRHQNNRVADELQEIVPPYEILTTTLLLNQAFRLAWKAAGKVFEPAGITASQWVSLWALLLSDQPMTPTEISRLLPIENPSVTALLDRLEERGLVRRRRSTRDRRSVAVSLTAEGRQMMMSNLPAIRDLIVSIYGNMSTQERQLMNDQLRKIRNASATRLRADPSHLDITIERLSQESSKILNLAQNETRKGRQEAVKDVKSGGSGGDRRRARRAR